MAKLRKCVFCGESIGTDEISVPYKKRYAHQRCFNLTMKTLQKDKKDKLQKNQTKKAKPKIELKDGLSEDEYKDKKQYYEYIRTLIDGELTAKIYALSEDYINKYSFTWKSMYLTLVYLHEIIGKELSGDVVGLIKYYHDEAGAYFQSIQDVAEKNKDKDVSTMYQEKVIRIKPHPMKRKQIDIETIGGE